MNQVKYPLFQWSLTLALLSGFLSRTLIRTDSPVMNLSLAMQGIVTLVLSLVPLTGIVLGVISWKREELKVGWPIVVIVLNVVQFLLILFDFFTLSSG